MAESCLVVNAVIAMSWSVFIFWLAPVNAAIAVSCLVVNAVIAVSCLVVNAAIAVSCLVVNAAIAVSCLVVNVSRSDLKVCSLE